MPEGCTKYIKKKEYRIKSKLFRSHSWIQHTQQCLSFGRSPSLTFNSSCCFFKKKKKYAGCDKTLCICCVPKRFSWRKFYGAATTIAATASHQLKGHSQTYKFYVCVCVCALLSKTFDSNIQFNSIGFQLIQLKRNGWKLVCDVVVAYTHV